MSREVSRLPHQTKGIGYAVDLLLSPEEIESFKRANLEMGINTSHSVAAQKVIYSAMDEKKASGEFDRILTVLPEHSLEKLANPAYFHTVFEKYINPEFPTVEFYGVPAFYLDALTEKVALAKQIGDRTAIRRSVATDLFRNELPKYLAQYIEIRETLQEIRLFTPSYG